MTTIKLDRQALAYIIEKDPEFYLELQRNILAEAIRKMVPKDVAKLTEILTPEVFAEMLTTSGMVEEFRKKLETALHGKIIYEGPWRDRVSLSEKQRNDVQKAVGKVANDAIERAAKARGETIAAAIELAEGRINETIDRKLTAAIDATFEQRVQVEVQRRLLAAAGGA